MSVRRGVSGGDSSRARREKEKESFGSLFFVRSLSFVKRPKLNFSFAARDEENLCPLDLTHAPPPSPLLRRKGGGETSVWGFVSIPPLLF